MLPLFSSEIVSSSALPRFALFLLVLKVYFELDGRFGATLLTFPSWVDLFL